MLRPKATIDQMVARLVEISVSKADEPSVPVSHIAQLIEALSKYIEAGGGEDSGLMRLIEKLDEAA